jgi:hypothetical protein
MLKFCVNKLVLSVVVLLVLSIFTGSDMWSAYAGIKAGNVVAANHFFEVTNGFIVLEVDTDTGQYSLRTGSQHAIPNERIFFSLGTGFDTVRSADSGLSYVTTDPDELDEGVELGAPNFSPFSDGYRAEWTVVNALDELTIIQEGQITGTTEDDTAVTFSTTIINNGDDDANIELRYFWDWELAGDDGPDFTPDGGETTTTEVEFTPPTFDFFITCDTESTSLCGGSSWSDNLVRLVYADWPDASGTAFDYTPTGQDVDPDSSVLYYFGGGSPFVILPGGSITASSSHGVTNMAPVIPDPVSVGGEFIGVDTTSVLVAGTQYTAAWMIPIIVAAAGFGLLIQTQKTRLKLNSCPSCKSETDDTFQQCRVSLFFVE